MTLEQLSKTGSYGNGDNVEAFYPEGTASHLKIWMQRERQHFSVQITAQDDWKAGIYYVSIYANRAKDEAHKEFLVSTRITHLH
jgi:hypothetical protein